MMVPYVCALILILLHCNEEGLISCGGWWWIVTEIRRVGCVIIIIRHFRITRVVFCRAPHCSMFAGIPVECGYKNLNKINIIGRASKKTISRL